MRIASAAGNHLQAPAMTPTTTTSAHTTTRLLIEEAFTHGELQLALSQLNAGMAAGLDGIALDLLIHLSTNGSSVLLAIIISSWLSCWWPQSCRLAYDDRRQVLFVAFRQRLKRNDWHISQFHSHAQLGHNPQVLTPISPSYDQHFIH